MVVVEEDFPPEQVSEDGAGGGEDDLVGVDLCILTCEGDVEMVLIISQPLEKGLDVSFVIVPCKSVVFRAHGLWRNGSGWYFPTRICRGKQCSLVKP